MDPSIAYARMNPNALLNLSNDQINGLAKAAESKLAPGQALDALVRLINAEKDRREADAQKEAAKKKENQSQ